MKKALSTFLLLIFFLVVACASTPERPQEGFLLMSEEEEIQFGHAVDAEIQRQFSILEDPQLTEKISVLGRELVSVSHRKELPYTFKIIHSKMINAFAAPGGYVYVTTGLLDFVRSKDELVAVLGHEIGHVVARHSVKAFRNYQLAQGALIGLTLGAALAGKDPNAVSTLGSIGLTIIIQGYSRENEREADKLGILYTYRAGYDPKGMVTFLTRLWEEKEKKKDPGFLAGIFRSHPPTEERIENANQEIEILIKGGETR